MKHVSFLPVALTLFAGLPALAQPPGPVWDPPESIDAPVTEISSSNAPMSAHTPPWGVWAGLDEWHIVYAKAGEIYHAVRDSSGWGVPERLTADPAASRDPKIAFDDAILHVVWEDERTGHPEIWTRRHDGSAWSAEECLTCDEVASRMPSLVAAVDVAVVAWQDGPDNAASIRERIWDGSAWGATAVVSQSPQSAREPTVAMVDDEGSRHRVYWSDTRHGLPEIYGREFQWDQTFGPEIRLTDLPGSSRRPSARGLECCGDFLVNQFLIVFEYDGDGVIETWAVCVDGYYGAYPPERVSANDGVASIRPQLHGFASMNLYELLGGPMPFFLSTWTESAVPGSRGHTAASSFMCPSPVDTENLSTEGVVYSSIAASRDRPFANLLLVDIEERDGRPTLIARRGLARSCYDPAFQTPPAILLAPEGIPENLFVVRDECAGGTGFFEGMALSLRFSASLDAALAWDETQEHPNLPDRLSDAAGEARFPIRGGGCATSGTVSLRASGVEVRVFTGARSPDVNGDCTVAIDDLAYVTGHAGTSDPCADLDGSGLVDAADVAIVEATLGDLCSQLVGVEEPAAEAAHLRVMPNPCRTRAVFRLPVEPGGSDGEGGVLMIVDAGGRLVRDLSSAEGRERVWDLRDSAGRRVAPGIYFAIAGSAGISSRQRTVVVVL